MVAGLPPVLAVRDAFFAAGLGFLLCIVYSAARLVLGSSRAVCIVCDTVVPALGALIYRSAAVSRFYAGVPRWYTLAACVAAFLLCRAAVAPFLDRVQRTVRMWLAWPFVTLWRHALCPFANGVKAKAARIRARRRQKKKNCPRRIKKRLQNTGQVLYNSK